MKNGTIIDTASMKQAGLDPSVEELSQMAYKAMNAVGADGKGAEDHCIERVNGMKDEYGTGASTLIMIYNSLGLNLKLNSAVDIFGGFFKYMPDNDIYNGEWSCVLHVHPQAQMIGSHGMLCYNVVDSKQRYNEEIVFVSAWANHYSGRSQAVSFYTRKDAYTADELFYNRILNGQGAGGRSDYGVLAAEYKIGSETSPFFRVVASQGSNF
jgi:hypothetical protein